MYLVPEVGKDMTGEKLKETTRQPDEDAVRSTLYDRLHLKMISLMHDTFYTLFVDPNKLLKIAGLAQGQNVLEVGCGPGFFTVAAAEIVGISGRLHTLDINPAAVERVKEKVSRKGLANVEAESCKCF